MSAPLSRAEPEQNYSDLLVAKVRGSGMSLLVDTWRPNFERNVEIVYGLQDELRHFYQLHVEATLRSPEKNKKGDYVTFAFARGIGYLGTILLRTRHLRYEPLRKRDVVEYSPLEEDALPLDKTINDPLPHLGWDDPVTEKLLWKRAVIVRFAHGKKADYTRIPPELQLPHLGASFRNYLLKGGPLEIKVEAGEPQQLSLF